MSKNKEVSVVLNGFRRPFTLEKQYEAIKKQSIPTKEIFFWKNHPEDNTQFDFSKYNDIAIAANNANYGVWARFAFALNATSEYVCVFDDDTIPSEKWFENCINCIENEQDGDDSNERGCWSTCLYFLTSPPHAITFFTRNFILYTI